MVKTAKFNSLTTQNSELPRRSVLNPGGSRSPNGTSGSFYSPEMQMHRSSSFFFFFFFFFFEGGGTLNVRVFLTSSALDQRFRTITPSLRLTAPGLAHEAVFLKRSQQPPVHSHPSTALPTAVSQDGTLYERFLPSGLLPGFSGSASPACPL